MTRTSTIYICQTCGAETRQYFGRCTSCGDWNSIVEEVISPLDLRSKKNKAFGSKGLERKRSQRISSFQDQPIDRISSGYKELICKEPFQLRFVKARCFYLFLGPLQ